MQFNVHGDKGPKGPSGYQSIIESGLSILELNKRNKLSLYDVLKLFNFIVCYYISKGNFFPDLSIGELERVLKEDFKYEIR